MIRFISMFMVFSLVAWPATGDDGENVPDLKLKKSQLDLPKDIASFKTLRILLLKNEQSIAVGTDGPYGVFDDKGRMLKQGEQLVSTKALAVDEGIQLGTELFRYPSITLISEGGGLSLNKHFYRNAIRFWKDADGKLAVNNEIDIEDYLKGVLPWEANPKWPVEALKAQAIASRTFALFKAIQHRDDPYDMKSGVLSQVYVGKKIEHRLTSAAIDTTRGQILTYRGKIFPGFFHST
ncbi:MAG: SpoIID/LytB domain-containing protein, partial [Candidatus Omnitrophica bacterium]|nr:SpoIID/LytB domain-containing protein [Candidatus Omnitrophota bacterium]